MEKTGEQKIILLSGGGTGGSVTPLLAMAEEIIKDYPRAELLFVGTDNGPEKDLVAGFSLKPIKFITLPSGKWRRYFSWRNFSDFFKIIIAFFKAGKILRRYQPSVVISAGSFVSVPLVWAAAVKKIPIIIHQQDVRPGLANRLMAPFARVITVTFEKSLLDYGPRAVWTGNPLSQNEIISAQAAALETKRHYNLDSRRPVILAVGGGTGSRALNDLVSKSLSYLQAAGQLVHLTGQGKSGADKQITNTQSYQAFEFLPHEEILKLMVVADLVISRAGLGVLTELSLLNKPAIIIPLPSSHQEDNASLLKKAEAAQVFSQTELTPEKLNTEINKLLNNSELSKKLGARLGKVIRRGAAASLAGIVGEILEAKK